TGHSRGIKRQRVPRLRTEPLCVTKSRLRREVGLLLAGTNDFDFYTAVLCTAFARGVVGDVAGKTLAFRIDAVSRNALVDQVVLDRCGTALGQALVVLGRSGGVSVSRGDDGFEIHALDLGNDLVQNLFAFGLDGAFVKVEERIGVEHNFAG